VAGPRPELDRATEDEATSDEVYATSQKALDAAFQSNPERFVRKPPERLDQPANPKAENPSLNSNAGCLVETFRLDERQPRET